MQGREVMSSQASSTTKVSVMTELEQMTQQLDDGLKWQEHVAALRRKCYAGLAKLRRLKDVLPVATKRKVYNALAIGLPHLDYCSVVWQECSMELRKKVEGVQNYGMRLTARTPSVELRRVLNWVPLERRREMFRLLQVHRCMTKR